MVPVDGMHNLFLGVVKHVLKTWYAEGILKGRDVQTRVRSLHVPAGVGRVLSSFENKSAAKKKNKPQQLKSLTADIEFLSNQ